MYVGVNLLTTEEVNAAQKRIMFSLRVAAVVFAHYDPLIIEDHEAILSSSANHPLIDSIFFLENTLMIMTMNYFKFALIYIDISGYISLCVAIKL